MQADFSVTELIDALIYHWSFWEQHEDFYLKELLPKLVMNHREGDEKESEIFAILCSKLNKVELETLPDLIKKRRTECLLNKVKPKPLTSRAERLRQAEAERYRIETQERERQEALRIQEEERERIKKEKKRQEDEARRNEFLPILRKALNDDFLNADLFFEENANGRISQKEYGEEKALFVQRWVKNLVNSDLDLEQSAAISSVQDHIQVIARAGSGKTASIVNRALFLQKHCGVSPNEMLLLAFNNKAAKEIKERLEKSLGGNAPYVMTFHALAHSIVHPEETLLHNGASEDSQGLNRAVQQLIDGHLRIPEYKARIRELMLSHFREDWDRIVEGGFDKDRNEFLKFRRSLIRESLKGDYVKSFGEKIIANFLFEHDIPYIYERNHNWDNINYKPDFTIFKTDKSGLIIEYFGLVGDAEYDQMSQAKRDYWKKKSDWGFLEFTPEDIKARGVENFGAHLESCLKKHGVSCKRLAEDEIWHRIERRSIDHFTRAVSNFIGRCRKRCLDSNGLDTLILNYNERSIAEDKFLKIVSVLYKDYLSRLKAAGQEDFDGLIQRAAELVSNGTTIFERKSGRGDLSKLRFIFIDEFQDFSELFHRLIAAIRKENPSVGLFCVGDDWQAINGFAGSDLKFFNGFEDNYKPAQVFNISTNYRSSKSVVNIGNALMTGLGKFAVAKKTISGSIILADLSNFEPTLLEVERYPGDIITPVLLRLISKALAKKDAAVVFLSRRNSVPWYVNYQGKANSFEGLDRFLEHIRSFFPKDEHGRITISTAHGYKGLERSTVIVLDAIARSYPLIHPDWIFTKILGENPQKITEDERRLFYVTLTRAIENVVIITERNAESPFLADIQRTEKLTSIRWAEFPPMSGHTTRLVVRIGNQGLKGGGPTFALKDTLKASGYQWQNIRWQCWEKSFSAKDFNLEILKKEVWASKADGIEVRIFNDSDSLVDRYTVNAAQWVKVSSK